MAESDHVAAKPGTSAGARGRAASSRRAARAGGGVELVIEYATVLDRGLTRERNEDRCGAFLSEDLPTRLQRGKLFVVADGMGGHAAGDVAAEVTIRTLNETYFFTPWTSPEAKLREAFLAANQAILTAAREAGRQGMGAAAVAAAVVGDRAFVAHLGDCRGYLVRDGRVMRLTSDHSWVQERMDAGRLSLDEARMHPYRNVLTRALGAESEAEPDVSEARLMVGDFVILCSDGLWGQMRDEEIALTATSAAGSAGVAHALADLALARGGPDNIAVIVLNVLGAAGDDAPTVKLPLRGRD